MLVTLVPGFAIAAKYLLRFLVPEKSQRSEQVLIGNLENLRIGTSQFLKAVHGNDLIAVRISQDEVKVFSSVCTHLGCRVHWDSIEGNFLCPCHMGRFNTNGEVIGGPPPIPLPAFPVKIDGNHLYVTVPVKEA
ncbi:MAG TPA: Rieske 2Fe-2S domain-containing protein [bacterium]|nr:Rieske 2Fe-2S domain-containing protein [bacterium]